MSGAFLVSGWLAAGLLGLWTLRLRSRLEGVAGAAHELRGAAQAMSLAAAAMRREPGGLRRAHALESEMQRMQGGAAARARRPPGCGGLATVRGPPGPAGEPALGGRGRSGES